MNEQEIKIIKETEKLNYIEQYESPIITELKGFTGTENYFKIPFSDYVYTDGIKALIDLCGCSWLISDIGILLSHKKQLEKPFLILNIKVKDDKAVITLKEDTDEKPIYTKKISYTDFPLKEYEFYIIDKVMLLKGEY